MTPVDLSQTRSGREDAELEGDQAGSTGHRETGRERRYQGREREESREIGFRNLFYSP